MTRVWKRVAGATGLAVVGAAGALLAFPSLSQREFHTPPPPFTRSEPATRAEAIAELEKATAGNPLDLLVIGGGATGTGTALDAVTRGLRTGLVEMDDFASGTSSRSTKLIHGGVRYLEKAVFHLDLQQLHLVFEALAERSILVHQAPHLCSPIPTMLPCYKLWEVPWYLSGLKMYDLLAALGRGTLQLSYPMSAARSKEMFGALATSGPQGSLAGSIVYYDGQMDDARLCLAAALTASCYGASVANYCKVVAVDSQSTPNVTKVLVEDRLGKRTFPIFARAVVNATGPFTDRVTALTATERATAGTAAAVDAAAQKSKKSVTPSRGAHLTLPAKYSPEGHALLIPKTSDGRVVFLIRWLDHTIAGTTDVPAEVVDNPVPSRDEVDFILASIAPYVGEVQRSEVLSAWAGLRPLAAPPSTANAASQEIVREHFISVDSASRVVTVTGGKWTTYRRMGADIVDRVVASFPQLQTGKPCVTENVVLVGGQGFSSDNAAAPAGVADDIWRHLRSAYGARAADVLAIAAKSASGLQRLSSALPVIEAEVEYAATKEQCETIEDFVCRRTRMAFLNAAATRDALPKVAALLGKHKPLPRDALSRATAHLNGFFVDSAK